MQKPLQQNQNEQNQHAKQLLQQIQDQDLEVDPQEVYLLQLLRWGWESPTERIQEFLQQEWGIKQYWAEIDRMIAQLMEMPLKQVKRWFEENLPAEFNQEKDPERAAMLLIESVESKIVEMMPTILD
ncbi:hypothetical protein F4212_02560 [Candidatus Poribacteria bacterium]|nr:hypothetical protein [Candidatus Poribacteria bacterium]